LFPNINCEDLHPEIEALITKEKVLTKKVEKSLNIIAKASFGFGDVNACVIFKNFKELV
jgi:3-oxoacyl-(acyl-carrier-protein) synthase